MMNATLRGKPNAGNPHVRFDEGEVASVKPRRGSLLYKSVFSVVCAAVLVGVTHAADPQVSGVSMSWSGDNREATITYQLANSPAIVTLEIVDGNGQSIDGALVGGSVNGDVYKKITVDGSHAITWHPSTGNLALPTSGVAARISAFPMSNPPDYMVVSSAVAGPDRVMYYPSVDYLPGGLHSNRQYKASKLVMRKIVAKGVTWMMGSGDGEKAKLSGWTRPANEVQHEVTLDHDYYMAVFEMTHGQYQCFTKGYQPPVEGSNFNVNWIERPVEQTYYRSLRGATQWPEAPASGSHLDMIRSLTGLDLDLPSEAEWEYACRAGHGDGYWGNGAAYKVAYGWYKEYNVNRDNIYNGSELWYYAVMPGRCATTGGLLAEGDNFYGPDRPNQDPSAGTAIVGSYEPNSWGLYDMHGNVTELTLDYYKEDITDLNGAVCTTSAQSRVIRGGCFTSRGVERCRSAARSAAKYIDVNQDKYVYADGFRLCCKIEGK